MKQRLRLLLVDFDGVLSNGRFYTPCDETEQELSSQAKHLFAPENRELLTSWMRGELTYGQVHDALGQTTGADPRRLDALLEASITRMPLKQHILTLTGRLRVSGSAVSLFTNNMDIFDTLLRTHHNLDTHFDHIYSSSAYGQLKLESDALLRRAMEDAGASTTGTALVDDSQSSCEMAARHGVTTFLYKEYAASHTAFEHWLNQTHIPNPAADCNPPPLFDVSSSPSPR